MGLYCVTPKFNNKLYIASNVLIWSAYRYLNVKKLVWTSWVSINNNNKSTVVLIEGHFNFFLPNPFQNNVIYNRDKAAFN